MYHFCDVLEDIDGKVVGVQLWQSPGAAGVFKPETPRSLLAQLGDILKWALFAIVGGSIGGWVGQLFFNHVFN
jgi:pimeloyl-ACP methyl ester carboxylesterase